MIAQLASGAGFHTKKFSIYNTKNISQCAYIAAANETAMNTTRNIRIATGIKRIELGNENVAMLQISDVLKQHRQALVTSLLSDLNTYINYQFKVPPTKDKLDIIRHKLLDLKNANISIAKYSTLIGEVLANENTYITSEPFYQEINEVIAEELNPSQLVLVK